MTLSQDSTTRDSTKNSDNDWNDFLYSQSKTDCRKRISIVEKPIPSGVNISSLMSLLPVTTNQVFLVTDKHNGRVQKGPASPLPSQKRNIINTKVKIVNKLFTALLDTGSDRTFMSGEAYDQLKNFVIGEPIIDAITSVGVRLAQHDHVATPRYSAKLKIEIDDCCGKMWFAILDGLNTPIILGMYFITSWKVIIDATQDYWSIEGSTLRRPLASTFNARISLNSADRTH